MVLTVVRARAPRPGKHIAPTPTRKSRGGVRRKVAPTPEAASDLLQTGRQALKAGQLEAAAAAFRQALALGQDTPEAVKGLASIISQSNDEALADEVFAHQSTRPSSDAWAVFETAAALKARGRANEAEILFRKVLEADPTISHAWRAIAQIRADSGDLEAALASYKNAAEIDPENAWTAFDMAGVLNRMGRLDEAKLAYGSALERNGAIVGAYRGLARIAREQGEVDVAFHHLQRAHEQAPDDVWLSYDLGRAAIESGRADVAEGVFEAMVAKDGANAPALKELARLKGQRGQWAMARELLERAIEHDPSSDWTRLEFANACRDSGKSDGAKVIYEQLLTSAEVRGRAAVELARLLTGQGRQGASVELLKEAARLDPHRDDVAYALGSALLGAGAADQAEPWFATAVTLASDPYWALLGQASALRKRGVADLAEDVLSRARTVKPEHPQAIVELAGLKRDQGVFDAARDLLVEAEALGADAVDICVRRAELALAGADVADAAQWFEKAQALAPDNSGLPTRLAHIYEQMGRVDLAQIALERARAQFPDSAATLHAVAVRAQMAGDLPSALHGFLAAAKADPSWIWLRVDAAQVMESMGDAREALSYVEDSLVEFGPRAELFWAKGECLRRQGLLQAATHTFAEGRARFPASMDLWTQSSLLAITCGRFDEVEEALTAPPASSPTDWSRVWQVRGMLALARWDYPGAQAAFRKARALNPMDKGVLYRLIQADMYGFQLEDTEQDLQELARVEYGANLIRGTSINVSQTQLGQIFDEFRLDADAAADTKKALASREDQRPRALAALVSAYPDNLAVAIAFMIAVRRSGLFDAPAPGATASSRRRSPRPIPATIVQFWDSAPPDDIAPYMRSWIEHNPDFAYRLFDLAAAEDYLKEFGREDLMQAFRRARQPAMKADIFRLAFLLRDGGIYVDADDRCQGSLAPLVASGARLVLYQEDLATIGNNFIASAPGDPVIASALDMAVQAVNRGDSDIVWLSTGPGLVTRALAIAMAAKPANLAAALKGVTILDRWELSTYAAIHCATAYKQTGRHWFKAMFGGKGK